MARILSPKDAHVILNAIASQALGKSALAATDTSSFVSVGETVLASGIENTLNALSIVIGKTIVGVKPYTAKITLFQEENTGLYSSRIRKITFYDKTSKAAGFVNTDLYTQNLYNGAENTSSANAVGSMYEQDKPVAIEFNFGGASVWDLEMTIYEDQLKAAFRNESEFLAFWNGLVTTKQNEIEETKEQFNRMTLLNFMAGLYDLDAAAPNGRVINLTSAFNTKYGTSYTSAQLRSTYLKEFLGFMVSEIKKQSGYMEERSALRHWNPSVTRDGVTYDKILKHTPKADQRLMLYKDLFVEAEALVLPEIFHEGMLSIGNYEGVGFWQSEITRPAISVTPAIPNTSNPAAQTEGQAVALDYVVGILFDKDAIITNFQFESADSTPLEARKRYRNVWYHNMKNSINDFTENAVLFIMAD